jgi:hypothetical protein
MRISRGLSTIAVVFNTAILVSGCGNPLKLWMSAAPALVRDENWPGSLG